MAYKFEDRGGFFKYYYLALLHVSLELLTFSFLALPLMTSTLNLSITIQHLHNFHLRQSFFQCGAIAPSETTVHRMVSYHLLRPRIRTYTDIVLNYLYLIICVFFFKIF